MELERNKVLHGDVDVPFVLNPTIRRLSNEVFLITVGYSLRNTTALCTCIVHRVSCIMNHVNDRQPVTTSSSEYLSASDDGPESACGDIDIRKAKYIHVGVHPRHY